MVDLPPELWFNVVRFTPLASLRTLYAVNRVFFEVAMKEKYRHVVLDRDDKMFSQKVDKLRNIVVAHFVKSVRIILRISEGVEQSEGVEHEKKIPPRGDSTLVDHQLVKSRHTRNENSNGIPHEIIPGQISEDILVMIQNFSNIENLHLDCGSGGSFLVEFANSLWLTVASKLKRIDIVASTQGLQNLLPAPHVKFSSLTTLHIHINHKTNALEDKPGYCEVQLSAASFVNSVQKTLQKLGVSSTPAHDMPYFYDNLEYFKHLTTLDIDLTLSSSTYPNEPPLSYPSPEFLLRHQDIIQHLSITTSRLPVFGTVNKEKWEARYEYMMPNLRSFSFGSNALTARPERILRFLKRHVSILQSLQILGPISPHEIDDLLRFMDKQPDGPALMKLSISIYRLDLQLMLKLMKQLPNLKILRLHIMKIAKGTSTAFTPGQYFPICLPPQEETHEFASDIMDCQTMKNWALHDIMITRHSCCADLTLWGLMRFFAICIPTVSSFAEMGHMDIPEPPNPQPNYDTLRCPGGSYDCFYGKDGEDASQIVQT